jgi:hypothetical protein
MHADKKHTVLAPSMQSMDPAKDGEYGAPNRDKNYRNMVPMRQLGRLSLLLVQGMMLAIMSTPARGQYVCIGGDSLDPVVGGSVVNHLPGWGQVRMHTHFFCGRTCHAAHTHTHIYAIFLTWHTQSMQTHPSVLDMMHLQGGQKGKIAPCAIKKTYTAYEDSDFGDGNRGAWLWGGSQGLSCTSNGKCTGKNQEQAVQLLGTDSYGCCCSAGSVGLGIAISRQTWATSDSLRYFECDNQLQRCVNGECRVVPVCLPEVCSRVVCAHVILCVCVHVCVYAMKEFMDVCMHHADVVCKSSQRRESWKKPEKIGCNHMLVHT